jgi:hypothetical protein
VKNPEISGHLLFTVFVAASTDDYSVNSSVPITFLPGSADRAEVCTPLTAFVDELVECEEDFSVLLALETPCSSLSLGNTVTAVTLVDGDGMSGAPEQARQTRQLPDQYCTNLA